MGTLLVVFILSGAYVLTHILTIAIPDKVTVMSRFPVSSKIFDKDGELLYEIHGEVKRSPVPLKEISPYLVAATLASEDKGFYEHGGISFTSMGRAAYINFRNKSLSQGGSTITQQLVKNIMLTRTKSFKRKTWEILLALRLERVMGKNEILSEYLNTVPYGRNTYGAEAAAMSYFNIHAKDLTPAQAASLAALPKSPSYLSPFGKHRDALIHRKDEILNKMLEAKALTLAEYYKARQEVLVFRKSQTGIKAPHFTKWVEQQLIEKYGRPYLETAGLNIYTTLDLKLQEMGEEIIKRKATENASRYGGFNASMVAIDPKTGGVRVMVGGKDYFSQPLPLGCAPGHNCKFEPSVNVALAQRQAGSSFKVYTYLTAFLPAFAYSPSTPILDRNENFASPGFPPYVPHNYYNRNYGLMPMRRALAGSLNVPAVRTLKMLGVEPVRNTAHALGITSSLASCGLSLTLGACEVRLLDHTAGFATIANMGNRAETHAIARITDKNARVVYEHEQKLTQVADPQSVYELISILTDTNARSFIFGSGKNLRLPDRLVAAKTGTSQNFRDGLTMGFTPSLSLGVWSGNNDASYMNPGSDGYFTAAPIWNEFMQKATTGTPVEDFPVPEGIVRGDFNGQKNEVISSFALKKLKLPSRTIAINPRRTVQLLSTKGLLMAPSARN
ncbi:MAG TPA: transglycosylase domain-containing protein [Patescibacteria group bacterium]|nr:transglycosylase domain-containing protein [Patescibacteria group bacterium]